MKGRWLQLISDPFRVFCEGSRTFAVGHMALGYLTGKAASKALNAKTSAPLLFLASMLPDIDLLVPGLQHRGATHSIVVYVALSAPLFLLFGKRAAPFLVALVQHSLLGDLLTGGGVEILWPLSTGYYGVQAQIAGVLNIAIEWVVFLTAMGFLWMTEDMRGLLRHHPSNLLLTVPAVAIILPSFLSFPLSVPYVLIVPHLVFLALFALSIMVDMRQVSKLMR